MSETIAIHKIPCGTSLATSRRRKTRGWVRRKGLREASRKGVGMHGIEPSSMVLAKDSAVLGDEGKSERARQGAEIDSRSLGWSTVRSGPARPRSPSLPKKSMVQKHRLRVRSVLVAAMLIAIVAADRVLIATSLGRVLYSIGALMIVATILGRFWCYVYNSGARSKSVISQGPYSICRNPIYLCSISAIFAVGLLAQSLILASLFGGCALLFFNHIIEGEEEKMTALHGDAFRRYRAGTPKFLPDFRLLVVGEALSVPGGTLARKIWKLAAAGLIFPVIEICNRLHEVLHLSLFTTF